MTKFFEIYCRNAQYICNLETCSKHVIFEFLLFTDCNASVCMCTLHLRLFVVLNAHGEDIDADDEGDEEVQVMAGTQCVDGQT